MAHSDCVSCLVLQQVNNEEELLGWQVTPYPQLSVITASKDPFDKLWGTAMEFYDKHDAWMNGALYTACLNHRYVGVHTRGRGTGPLKLLGWGQVRMYIWSSWFHEAFLLLHTLQMVFEFHDLVLVCNNITGFYPDHL